MQLTELQIRVMRYIDRGLGAYHLVVTRQERNARDRILVTLSRRGLIQGGAPGHPLRLTDEGSARYERQRGPVG